jgi:uncharacterized protein YajQ (UPF0234 family)
MPSFDITPKSMVALRNAVEGANRKITGRYDFKGRMPGSSRPTSCSPSRRQRVSAEQMQALLLPEMTAKKIDVRCLKHGDIQKVSGNKVKQELTVRVGIEQEQSKRIVKLIKDSKLKVQASIQGEAVRVSGAKRDLLQECIALVRKEITDYPLQYGNFRD